MNDLPNAASEDNINLYADNTNIFNYRSNAHELTNKAIIGLCRNSVCKWFVANSLSLTAQKTCHTVFLLNCAQVLVFLQIIAN